MIEEREAFAKRADEMARIRHLPAGEMTEALIGPVAETHEPLDASPIPWRLEMVERIRQRICKEARSEIILPGKIGHRGWHLRARFRLRDWPQFKIKIVWELRACYPSVYLCRRLPWPLSRCRDVTASMRDSDMKDCGFGYTNELYAHRLNSDDPERARLALGRLSWLQEQYLQILMMGAYRMAQGDQAE